MSGETVLIVEDDVALLQGVRDTLELAGYQVLTASRGEEAVALFADATPDIVISDIMMPEMDGFELFRTVRADPAHTSVPFVFLSARSERADVRAGMRMGADDYITKPFDGAELLEAVSSRLRRRDELRAARRRAYARLAEQMVITLNHELRAPLAQLSAFAEMLEDGGTGLDPAEFDTLLQGVLGGVGRLSRVVTDIAMLADLRSGRAQALFDRRCRVIDDLPMLLRSAAATDQQRASDGGHPILVDVPSGLPPIVGDEAYLRDAIGRLIDNAIKFSRDGGGPIRISVVDAGDTIRIAVSDEGVGIPPHTAESLFEPFRQVDRGSLEQQGLGNGLAICHELVQMHGGSIDVETEPEVGSTFTLNLPVVAQ